ncbi:MAG TPA: DinB family protein [Candidatus Limnocylindrales bacterium]|nr:DinB family protein [Candidatus Limnocylindrales bacterium]
MSEPAAHPLVEQLRFTRSEFRRGLRGTPEEDAVRRLEPMNSIGWIVAHMAWHEQRYWLTRAQGLTPRPDLNEIAANGGPPTTPSLEAMLAAWAEVTAAADPWLAVLAASDLDGALPGAGPRRSFGSAIQRVTYHYWFHTGEILAIRQVLQHRGLPEFVGNIDDEAPYRTV